MSKTTTTIIALVLLGGYAFGLFTFWGAYITNKDVVIERTYSGRLYLQQEEYSQFKEYLAEHPEVIIAKMDVLSSPDALIDMRLIAPTDTLVPYGEMVKECKGGDLYYAIVFTTITPLLTVILMVGILIVTSSRES